MFPVSMFSMKMYPKDTVNCFPVLPEETLVVRYMRQDVASLVEDTDQMVPMTIFVVGARRVKIYVEIYLNVLNRPNLLHNIPKCNTILRHLEENN